MSWITNVEKNIFPLSHEKYSLKIALNEWSFVNMIDNVRADSECQLCNHFPIRYKFLIANTLTNEEIYVGSECILRFEEENFSLKDENGNFVSNETLKNEKNKALKKILSNYLNTVTSIDPKQVISIVEDDEPIPPRKVPKFYYPYREADADIQKIMEKYLRVNLRTDDNKNQLIRLINQGDWRSNFIKKFMSPQQIEKYFSI